MLVEDALLRTAAAADIAGIRALLVHAKDDEARGWYEALKFEPSLTDPLLLMKDLRAILSGRPKDGEPCRGIAEATRRPARLFVVPKPYFSAGPLSTYCAR